MGAEHRKFCFGAGVAGMEGVAGPSSPPAAAILLDRRQTEEIAKTLFLTAPRHSRRMFAQQQRAEALPCLPSMMLFPMVWMGMAQHNFLPSSLGRASKSGKS